MDFNIDIRELTLEKIGEWPDTVKYIVISVVCFFVLILGYWLDTRNALERFNAQKHVEKDLRIEFKLKYEEVGNLPAYRHQLEKMQQFFKAMLRQLPGKTEVPGLLDDISKMGIASGLEFKLLRPGPEKRLDFYEELPMQIAVIGDYHQLANFVSRVSELDRIVTLEDFTIEKVPSDQNNLNMNITAKTYRYTGEQ